MRRSETKTGLVKLYHMKIKILLLMYLCSCVFCLESRMLIFFGTCIDQGLAKLGISRRGLISRNVLGIFLYPENW